MYKGGVRLETFKFVTAMSELIDTPQNEQNPLVTTAKFIFADDRPNGNKQAIPYEEFDSIAASAVGMPVKINFDGIDAQNHVGSSPIGHIKSMQQKTLPDGSHQLIAEADLWNAEFPEIVSWLKAAWASGDAPGISWELKYKDSNTLEGIQWLRGVIASAATFVKHPAYGPRTALLALASIKEPEKHWDEMAPLLIALAEQFKSVPKVEPKAKGGKQMTEEEIAQLKAAEAAAKAEASSKQTEIEKLMADIATRDGEITTLKDQVTSLEKNALIDDRVRQYTEKIGTLPAEAAESDKKKSLFASFNDDQWGSYLEDLAALKKSATPIAPAAAAAALKTAQASQGTPMPRVEVPLDGNLTYDSLRAGLRDLARPNSSK